MDLDSRLDSLVDRFASRADTGPVRLRVDAPGYTWSTGADRPYFIASITKMFTGALVMQLVDDRALDLDQPVAELLPSGTMRGLHVRDGVDRGSEICLRHLLAHTSGLADYFEDERDDGSTTFERALPDDQGWTFDDVLTITRGLRPAFDPGAPGKAHYSDTNYQLLGAVIEVATGSSYATAVTDRIAGPLGLSRTYVFGPETLHRQDDIDPIRDGTTVLAIPRIMASFQADGGVVSTLDDSARFLRGFFDGELFDSTHLRRMQSAWRRIFWPLRYGEAMMRLELPRVMTGLRPVPALVGHSGASGSVLFRTADPGHDLAITATVNQVRKRSMPYQLMTRVVVDVLRAAPPTSSA